MPISALQVFFDLLFSYNLFLPLTLKLASLNINGINNVKKQLMLIDHMKYNKIDILFIQEHNIRDVNNICPKLNELYFIILNLAIAHKGGTAILIDRRLEYKIINHEMSADSRIISCFIELYNKSLHLINVYAPSG